MNSQQPGVRVLNKRYVLQERLGEGSMGSVWKAYDTLLERTVAAKELVSGVTGGDDRDVSRERVRREALALAKVEHPAIVSIHDLIYDGRSRDPWIVMAYVRGRSLDWIIAEAPPLDEQKVARIGFAVLQGLMACHERDVCHRDVKPANIVMSDDGAVRLVDFGIARILGMNTLTVDSKVIGTPEFLAPELFNGQSAGPETDLWALGVTLYYALDGRSPFRAANLSATIAAIVSKTPPQARTGGPLAALVLDMLRKHPSDRPDADTVAACLRSVATSGHLTSGHLTSAQQTSGHLTSAQQTSGQAASGQQTSGQAASGQQTSGQQTSGQAANDRASRPHPQDRGGSLDRGGSQDRWDSARAAGDRARAASNGRSAGRPDPTRRWTPLSGLPAFDAAKIISEWPTERAVADLLSLEEHAAAKIISRCDGPAAGKLLSAVAADRPAWVRKILEMVKEDRAGQLLDHMSSPAAALALDLPPVTGALRVISQADDLTVVGALSEMKAPGAAALVLTMDDRRAVYLLGQADPVSVAGIASNIPAPRRQALLNKLPDQFRELVVKHL